MKTIRELIGYEGDAWERLILMEVVRRHPRPLDIKEVADALLTNTDVVLTFARGMAKDRNGRIATLRIDSGGLSLIGDSEWIGALGHPGADICIELEARKQAMEKAGLKLGGEKPEPMKKNAVAAAVDRDTLAEARTPKKQVAKKTTKKKVR